jgi:hypothetical protein
MSPEDPPRNEEDVDAENRRQKARKELEAEWDRRLRACFDAPDFGEKVDAIMDACGRTKVRPKAGSSW